MRPFYLSPLSDRFKRQLFLSVAFFLLLFFLPVSARVVPGYQFSVYNSRNGLSDNIVTAVFQDDKGYMWFGTVRGINRFDGVKFEVFDTGSGLLNDNIRAINQTADKRVWFGTKHGLAVKQGAKWQVYTVKDNLPDNVITSLAVMGSAGNELWVGTKNGAARLFRGHFLVIADKANKPIRGSVTALYPDNRGNIWICMEKKLLLCRDGVVVKQFADQAGLPLLTESVIRTPEGDLLFATRNRGVFKYEAGRFYRVYSYRGLPLPANRSIAFLRDLNGQLVIPSWGHGVFVPAQNGYRQLMSANSNLPNDTLWGHYVDREGNVWLGTHGSGVVCMRSARAVAVDTGEKNNISFIFRERNGTLWIAGTKALFYRLANGRYRTVMKGIHTTWICEDQRGRLWFGTGNGLFRWVNNRMKPVQAAAKLPQKAIVCVEPVGKDRLLILLTNGRLYLLELSAGNIQRIKFDGFVQMIQPDPDKTDRMIILAGNKLYAWKDGTGLQKLPVSISRKRSRISCFYYAGPKRIYLGGQDLFVLNGSSWQTYGKVNGLDSGRIVSIRLSRHSGLWLGTLNGVFRYYKGGFSRIDSKSGLSGDFCSPHAILLESDRIWVGTSSGLSLIRTGWLRKNNRLPGVVITGVKAGGQFIRGNGDRTFSYDQKHVQFQFAGLSFVRPEWNRYRCRLEGLDPPGKWHDIGNRRFMIYNNLSPGEYRFEVLGSNNDGMWALQPAMLRFEIVPPYWQRSWFIIFLVTAAFGLLYAVYRWRMRFVRRSQRMLEEQNAGLLKLDKLKDEILSNTSHELRTPLHGMVGLAESLLNGAAGNLNDQANENLQMIIYSGRRLSRIIDDLLEFSRLKNHDIELQMRIVNLHGAVELVLELLNSSYSGKENLKAVNRVPVDLNVCADEQRLEQILYNLAGNAFKFTEQGEVAVSARILENCEFVEITVSDTGCGIKKEDTERIFDSFEQGDSSISRIYGGTGLGLAITSRLVLLHGGTIEVNSEPGEGSSFTFYLPSKVSGDCSKNKPAQIRAGLPADSLFNKTDPQHKQPAGLYDEQIQPASGYGQKIYVVDDEPVNRRLLENHLKLAGYRVISMESGRQLLKQVELDLPAVVLLDVMMPGITGLEVTRKLRERFSMHELPVILLTARHQDDDLIAGFEAGANDYLIKPFHRRELLARVATLAALREGVHAHVELVELEKEMAVARTVQQSILNSTNSLQALEGVDCAVYYRPMNLQVGGDYYNVCRLPDGGFSLLIADATGHGVQAALTTMQIDMLNRSSLAEGGPAKRLAFMNRAFTTQLHSHNFFTAVMVHWYPDHLLFASAGHPTQYLLRTARNILDPLNAAGRPVGLNEDEQFEQIRVSLNKEDQLVLFTDGLLEQDSPEGHQFDENGLISCFSFDNQETEQDLNELMNRITRHWNAFRGYQQVRDDVTVLLFRSIRE